MKSWYSLAPVDRSSQVPGAWRHDPAIAFWGVDKVPRYLILSTGLLLLAGGCAPNTSSSAPVSGTDLASVEGAAASGVRQAAPACAESADPAQPWVGEWRARSGDAMVTMSIAGEKVRGHLKTSVTTFAFSGGVSDTGYINITLAGNDHWDRAEMGGKFPVVQLRSGSDGRSFDTIDGRKFRLCT